MLFPFLFFFKKSQIKVKNRASVSIKPVAEMGLLKNIVKLPSERIRDWRKAVSSIGPRTKAKIKGAISYSSFLKK